MGVGVGDQLGNAAMPDSHERKPVANAGLFIGGLSELFADELAAARSPTARTSLRSFDDAGGAVGLGIVAAMSGAPVGRSLPPAPRSEPIPIGSVRAAADAIEAVAKEEELSESYTCVIWHVDGGSLAQEEGLLRRSERPLSHRGRHRSHRLFVVDELLLSMFAGGSCGS